MSGFFSRHNKAIVCTLAASAGLYFIYRYYIYKKQQIRSRAEALAGIEYRRRRVEKLVELRDKLVCIQGNDFHTFSLIVNDGAVVNSTNFDNIFHYLSLFSFYQKSYVKCKPISLQNHLKTKRLLYELQLDVETIKVVQRFYILQTMKKSLQKSY